MQITAPNTYISKPAGFYVLFALLSFIAFNLLDFNLYYGFATMIFIHEFLSLYFKLGDSIPIRNWIGAMFSLNYLLSPVLMWSWLDPYMNEIYKMQGDPETYFTYAIPAMLLLIVGLNVFSAKVEKIVNEDKLIELVERHPNLPLQLIVVGLVAEIGHPFVPSEAQLLSSTVAYFKFAGFFLSLLTKKRFNVIFFLLTFGVLLVKSLTSSMFNDLLNMLFFLGFFLCIKYKPSHLMKIAGVIAGIMLVVFIQNIKFILRAQVTNSITDLTKLGSVFKESQSQDEKKTPEEKLINVVFRVNQGWFTSSTIDYYHNGGFELQKGNHSLSIIQTSIVPRFLAPNRILMGDRSLFNKYSGYYVEEGSSMALGILSDAYIDYAFWGILVVGVFGMMISFFIWVYSRLGMKYALVTVFFPISFFNIRPDLDTYAILGSVLKTTFILWICLLVIHKFYLKEEELEEEDQAVLISTEEI